MRYFHVMPTSYVRCVHVTQNFYMLIGLTTLKTFKCVPLYSLVTGQCWIQVVFVFHIIVFMTRLYNLVRTAIKTIWLIHTSAPLP
jgi:hypothetical protein